MKRRCAGCSAVIDGRANKLWCSRACENRGYRSRQTSSDSEEVSASVKSVIRGSNGVLIATVARLGHLGGPTVLDSTYGRGSFWTRYRPAGLLTNDMHTPGVDMRADFREMPLRDASMPVVVFDPPYISTGSRETSSVDDLYDRFGLGNLSGWRAIRRLIGAGLAEQARILTPRGRLLVKCMDHTESGRKVWNTFHVYNEAERLGLRMVDRFHHLTGGGPQPLDNLDGSPREQKTAREVTSMLLVFTK